MKQLILTRSRQFASALVPYWVITSLTKAEFMQRYQLPDDTSGGMTGDGQPARRMEFDPWEYGPAIGSGGTLRLELEDTATTVFAVTMGGLLSNELALPPQAGEYRIRLTTTGGWLTPGCPQLAWME